MDIRDRRLVRQTVVGLSLRILAVGGSFLAMPLMLERMGAVELGVWLVLLSIFQWITFLDLGVSAGARNEMARAFASEDETRIRHAIATGLYYTVLISGMLALMYAALALFSPLIPALEEYAFKGASTGYALWIVGLGSCAAFALNFIQMVYAAEQRSSAISFFAASSSCVFLGLVYWWPLVRLDDLTHISGLYLISMVAANVSLVLWYFRKRSRLLPRVNDVRPEMRGRILGFGMQIFFIQIAAMIVFTTARVLVSTFFDPASVVVYDAGFKLFAVITMIHSLLLTAFWSSCTNAHAQGDWPWLQRRVKLLQSLTLPILVVCLAVSAISPWVIERWMTQAQVGPWSLYISFALLTALSAWANVFAYFLNGIGDTKLQLVTSVLALVVHFPACYLFVKVLGFGLAGINAGTMLSITFFAIAGPVYVQRLLRHSAHGSPSAHSAAAKFEAS